MYLFSTFSKGRNYFSVKHVLFKSLFVFCVGSMAYFNVSILFAFYYS